MIDDAEWFPSRTLLVGTQCICIAQGELVGLDEQLLEHTFACQPSDEAMQNGLIVRGRTITNASCDCS